MRRSFAPHIYYVLIGFLLLGNSSLPQSDSLLNAVEEQSGKDAILTYIDLLSSSELSYDERLSYSEIAMTEAELLNDSLLIAAVLNAKSLLIYDNLQYDKAITGFEKALGIAKRFNSLDLQSSIYYNLGFAYHKKNRNVEGAAAIRQAIHLNRDLQKLDEWGDALNGLGYFYWTISQFDSALFYYEKGLEVRSELKDSSKIGQSLNNIGIIYWYWSIYDKALEYYRQALNVRRSIGDEFGVVLVLNNIGLLYKEWHYYTMAREYLFEAMQESEHINQNNIRGYVRNNIGELFIELNQPDSAMFYFQESLKEYKKTNNPRNYSLIYNNIGDAWLKLNEIDKAKEILKESIVIADSTDNFRLKAIALRNLGVAAVDEGNLFEAIDYLNEAVNLGVKINAKEDLIDSYIILANTLEKIGNYKEALRVHKLYTSAKDSIDAEEVNKRIIEFKMRYQIEKNERQLQEKQYEIEQQSALTNILFIASFALLIIIVIIFNINRSRLKANRKLSIKNKQISDQNDKINLQKKQLEKQQEKLKIINRELGNTNEKLNILNSTKDKFFSIVSHDLKNPFQALLGYAELLDEDFEELDDDEKKDIISNLLEVSQNSFRLVENLLNWSKAQLGRLQLTPELLDLKRIAADVAEILEGSFITKNIIFQNNINTGSNVFADKNAVTLVLRNLLTNAIKFTPRNGTINVDCEITNGNCKISVHDSGLGMEEDVRKKLFKIDEQITREGTNQEKGTGLGLILCKEFVEKSGGEIWVESTPLQGSTFYFTLPVSKQ